MSMHVTSWVWDHTQAKGTELLLLLALADLSNQDGESFPSIKTLAHRCRCSERQVQRLLNVAIARGKIDRRIRVRENGSSTSSIYRILGWGGCTTRHRGGDTDVTGGVTPIVTRGVTPASSLLNCQYEQSFELEESRPSFSNGSKAKPEDEQQVVSYCLEVGLSKNDGIFMFAHWQGNNFSHGRKPMNDWKAVIRSWKAAGYMPSQKNGTNHTASKPKKIDLLDRVHD